MHTLTILGRGEVPLGDESFPLAALYSIAIPALCLGKVPHGAMLKTAQVDGERSWVYLVREPGTMEKGLIVDHGPVDDGDVYTSVFNITNEPQLVRKGEVISRLIRVEGAAWIKR